jgi:hypothetical protein
MKRKKNAQVLKPFVGQHEYFEDGKSYTYRQYTDWTANHSANGPVGYDTIKGRLHSRPYCTSEELLPASMFQSQELRIKRKQQLAKQRKDNKRFSQHGNSLPLADSLLYEQTVWKSVFSQAMLRSSITEFTCKWGKQNA